MATKTPTPKKKTATKATATKKTVKSAKKAAPKKVAAAKAKTVKKSTTKKATPKKTVRKAAISKAKVVSTVKVSSPLMNMRKFNIFSALLLAVGAGLIVAYGNELLTSFTSSYLAENALTESGELLPAVRELFSINLSYLIAGVLGAAAVWRALLATSLRERYEAQVDRKLTSLNWIELGVFGPWIVAIIASLTGVRDIMTLLLIGGVVSVTAVLGYLSDRYNMLTNRSVLKNKIAIDAVMLPWFVIAVSLTHTYIYGMINLSSAVYGLIALGLLVYVALALAHKKQIAATGRFAEFIFGEKVIATMHVLLLAVIAAIPFLSSLTS